ncbi:PAS domain-containing sensor histidine kinase [Pedobacter sandarakinus]|uniref:PAS domain-containing sensor histidine kinase n=1 Tax=Pedobacter sandarakinus TaxID=353156 RepID=UPI002246BE53|nr:PAS domain-containing sensor histidine kinase [Pedobacter sandarakinus]MCX2574581.1 PAS domain-containing sensor histidine kinase [Pedobacter sandarakinus]
MQNLDSLFCQLGDMSVDGYFIYDLETHALVYYNAGFSNILSRDLDEFKHSPLELLDMIHPDDRDLVADCYEEILTESGSRKYEFRLLLKDEVEKYVKLSVGRVKISDKAVICGVIEDITIDKHNKIHIEQINSRKNIALEVLSHDLKEPFGMMKMAASSMATNVEQRSEAYLEEGLNFIIEMCERNLKMVRSLINREFLKSAEIEIKKERTDLIWELKDLIRFYRRSHLKEERNFYLNCKSDRIYLRLDTMKFLQVLNNLISNAIKFTREQGTITLAAEEKEQSVLISVSDDGIGIPNDLKSHLFERSAIGLRLGLRGEESHGLGMGIIKSIVDLHGGKIWFTSVINEGTTFYIELPK